MLEIFALLVIGFAFPIMYGEMVGSKRQGRVVLAVMGVLWLSDVDDGRACSSRTATSSWPGRGVDQSISADQAGGNMESKEVRFGAASSGIFAVLDDRHVDRLGRQRPRQLHAARAA